MRERVIERETERESEKERNKDKEKFYLLTVDYLRAEKIEFTKYNIIRK